MRLTTKILIGSILTIFATVIAIICVVAYMERTKDESMYRNGNRIEYIDIEGIDSLIIESADVEKKYTFSYLEMKTSESTKRLSVYEDTYKIISSTKRGNTLIIKSFPKKAGFHSNTNVFFLTLPTQSSFAIVNNIPSSNVHIRDTKLNRLYLNLTDGIFYVKNSHLDTLNVVRNVKDRDPEKQYDNRFRGNTTIGYFNYVGNDIIDGQLKPYSTIERHNINPKSNDSIFMKKMNGLE